MNLVSATDQARALPWLMDTRIGTDRASDVLERTPRFRFEGEGPLSQRRIVPETAAARDALAGASGGRMEQVLRGWLGTFDAQSAVTELESLALSVDAPSAALNHLLGAMSWPEADFGIPIPKADATKSDRRAVQSMLREYADQFGHPDGMWGVSYRSINVAPKLTQWLRDAAAGTATDPELNDESTHVLVHELAHRLTEPPLHDPAFHGDPFADPVKTAIATRIQLLSEGSADLISHLPGFKADARARMGLPPAVERSFQSGYAPFVEALATMLRQAGLESNEPVHRADIIELLERPDMVDVPDAIASLIVDRQGIDWKHQHEIAKAIQHIGEHGIYADDEQSAATQQAEIRRRTDAAVEEIGLFARMSNARRDRV